MRRDTACAGEMRAPEQHTRSGVRTTAVIFCVLAAALCTADAALAAPPPRADDRAEQSHGSPVLRPASSQPAAHPTGGDLQSVPPAVPVDAPRVRGGSRARRRGLWAQQHLKRGRKASDSEDESVSQRQRGDPRNIHARGRPVAHAGTAAAVGALGALQTVDCTLPLNMTGRVTATYKFSNLGANYVRL